MTEKEENVHNANFPIDPDGRVYHLGVKKGEVANRILSVGDSTRAKLLTLFLDDPDRLFVKSNRGFTVYTGTFKKVPISIIATGMGIAMIDFVVRECRFVVNGSMAIIRFGTCGTPSQEVPIGSIAVAKQSILVSRNPDHFIHELNTSTNEPPPYEISRPIAADTLLFNTLYHNLEDTLGNVVVSGTNATGDSFYSSQGRYDPNFRDDNRNLLDELVEIQTDLISLEMETFQLFHLARCSVAQSIRGAAATIVLAQRKSNEFLDNDSKHDLEKRGGLACLQSLIDYPIEDETTGPECVWNQSM